MKSIEMDLPGGGIFSEDKKLNKNLHETHLQLSMHFYTFIKKLLADKAHLCYL